MKKKTAIPILLCAVCLVTLLRCQKTESDKSTETVNDSSSQNRLAEEAVLPEDSQNDTPSGDSYEEFEGSGYIADGCYFEFIDMTVDDADREKPLLYLTYRITNTGKIPFVPDNMFTVQVRQAEVEIDRVNEKSIGYDRLLEQDLHADILDVYSLRNANDYLYVDVYSTTENVRSANIFDIYNGYTDVTTSGWTSRDESTGKIYIEPTTFRCPEVSHREISYKVAVPEEWFDKTDYVCERRGGGSMVTFYSLRERNIGGRGVLFALGWFESEYNYGWAGDSELLGTVHAPWDKEYNLVAIYPNFDQFDIVDEESYRALFDEVANILASVQIEGAEYSPAQRIYNILTNHAKTLGLLRKIGRFTLELCAKTTACFSLFTEIVRQVCAKKGEGGVVRLINGQLWYCCPVCGQKLHKLTPDAVCSGVITFCKKCKWEGVMNIRDRKGA